MIINKPRLLSIAVIAALSATAVGCLDSDHSSDDQSDYMERAQKLVVQLTDQEKIRLLVGSGWGTPPINIKTDVAGVAGYINGIKNDDLDLPAVKLADGPAGLRISPTRENDPQTYYATAWPIGSLLASSWDPKLVEEVGKAFGNEVKEFGVDFLLAPGMNIQRNPLNGRNFEYYSEDPVLGGIIAAAMVDGVESNGVGTTIKHFVANNSETNRRNIDGIMTPRSLREIYLRSFHIAIKNAQPWALMTSYNKINGTYTNARRDLLTSIIRDEWSFDGLVMSDWMAGDLENPYTQIEAGNDLIEPGGENIYNSLLASYENGDLSLDTINTSAIRILTEALQTPSYDLYTPTNTPDSTAHAALSRRAAAESMVLLKNEGAVLPITDAQSVAAFGINQINTYKGGTGSGDVNVESIVNIATGLADRFALNSELADDYAQFFEDNKVEVSGGFGNQMPYYTCDEPTFTTSEFNDYAAANDVAVISIGRIDGEGSDRLNERGSYLLSNDELTLIQGVATAFHAQDKKVVVVLNVNGVVDTSEWSNEVDGILLAYMPGQEAGDAIADVLSGDINPSGKLAQTFPINYSDVPSSATFPGTDTDSDGTPDIEYYNEGIYVGYRYYTTFNHPVAYPFGFGLSYTTFGYSAPQITKNTLNSDGAEGSIKLSVVVTNTGNVTGKEAAEVYISAPQVELDKPAIELKAFAKTNALTAGSQQTLKFEIPADILASFDASNNQWIIEPGEYSAYISPSSDITNVAPQTFTINSKIIVSNTTPGALALPEGVDPASFITVSQ